MRRHATDCESRRSAFGDCPILKLPAILLSSLAMATAAAQTWTFPMDPRAAYLRTNNDSPTAPLVLDLATLGITPGQWLHLETAGAYRHINGGTDTYRSLVGVPGWPFQGGRQPCW